VDELLKHYPQLAGDVKSAAAKAGVDAGTLRFLPVVSRRTEGVALLAPPEMNIVGYLKVDGFF
jgi:hypothetical protein